MSPGYKCLSTEHANMCQLACRQAPSTKAAARDRTALCIAWQRRCDYPHFHAPLHSCFLASLHSCTHLWHSLPPVMHPIAQPSNPCFLSAFAQAFSTSPLSHLPSSPSLTFIVTLSLSLPRGLSLSYPLPMALTLSGPTPAQYVGGP